MATFFSFIRAMANMKVFLQTGQAGDGREKALLDHVLQTAERCNPQSVLQAIDSYSRRTSWLMNIGDDKGPFLDSALSKYNPRVALEIGTYCGYSAVRIASQMQKPKSMLLAVEMNPLNCQIATHIIDHAGLSSKVRVVEGKFDERLEAVKQFLEEMEANFFDFVLLDHWKDCYMPDYLLLKENGMMKKGSGIFSDNMGPLLGPADFKKYIKTHPEELETQEFKSTVEYTWWMPDSVWESDPKNDIDVRLLTVFCRQGLSSKVRVVEGKFDERLGTIKKFLKEMDAPFFEFVFLDHWKNRYMPDYLLLKEQGMIRKGSGIFADNMGFLIGPADFRKYVKTHPEELEIEEFKSNAGWMPDSVTVSTYKLD